MLGFLFCALAVQGQKSLIPSPALALYDPPLDNNGTSAKYEFKGDYSVTSYTSRGGSNTQLGYDSPESSAMLVSKVQTMTENYRIDYKIRLHRSEISQKANGGIAFFITRDPEIKKGNAFGVTENFDGALVVLDFKGDASGKPFIGAVVKNGIAYNPATRGQEILTKAFINESLLIDDTDLTVMLEHENNKLMVWFGKPTDESLLLTLKSDILGKGCYAGISSSQNGGSPLVRLYGIRFYEISFSGGDFMSPEEPKKKTNKMVWVILILVGVGIGYYLFSNYKKYK